MSQSISLYKLLAKKKLFSKSINFDLKRIKLVLKKLGHPENNLKNVINIIGSDGKFSLLMSLKFFIEGNSQKTSAYISPSLKDIRERFWMGDRYLTFTEIRKTIKEIEKKKVKLTVFETLTVIFILNAANKDNNYNLIEAGALFAKDSTNVFNFPKIQAVVNINKQHLNFLKRKTISEIILQKVGFLSNFTNIYIGKQKPFILKKIKHLLSKNNSKIYYPNLWKLVKSNNKYFYQDQKNKIEIKTRYIHSRGLIENLCMAIKIALDIKISKKVIIKTIPKIKLPARIEYLEKGKLIKKIYSGEKILLDGCHSEISAKNLADYLKTIKMPIYGIWGMTKNKNPEVFIKKFKGIFKKIVTIPIENESASVSNSLLMKVANKNNFVVEKSKSFDLALKKISSKEKKVICIFGSLYLCGSVLNKN